MKLGRVLTYKDVDEAKKLVGKKVRYSDNLGAIESDGCGSGDTLLAVREDSIEPFLVETARYHADKKDRAYQFIREVVDDETDKPRYEPYDLSDPKVRDSLRGRWYTFKVVRDGEYVIERFSIYDGIWNVNGHTASYFCNYCTWLDGTPCGRRVD